MVEERFQIIEVHDASRAGAAGSENVGMSSNKADENSAHRKSKVSWATVFGPGLGGPNLDGERYRGMDCGLIFPPRFIFILL